MRTVPCLAYSTLALLSVGCALQRPESPEMLQQRYSANIAQGRAYLTNGEFIRAARSFEEAIRCLPGASEAHALLGFADLKLKAFNQAETELLRAVELEPGHVSAWCNLGVISVRNRRYDEAQQRLERAVALDPTFPLAQYSLGNLLMFRGERARARETLMRALELDPNLLETVGSHTFGFPGALRSIDSCLGFARVFANAGKAEETCRYLEMAQRAGFKDWKPLLAEQDFDKVRELPQVRKFLD